MDIRAIQNGAIIEAVNEAFREVFANIGDPNTEAKTKREVVLKMTIKPDEKRVELDLFVRTLPAPAPLILA